MKDFFNRLFEILKNFKAMDKHQMSLFLVSFAVAMLIGTTSGYIATILFAIIAGLVFELVYCYVPLKETVIMGKTIRVPDLQRFRAEMSDGSISRYHDFDKDNGYFCYAAVLLYVCVRFVMSFF